MTEIKHILAAQLPPSLLEHLTPALSRAEFDFNQVATLASAAELVRLIPFGIVLVGCQAVDPALDRLLATIREGDSASRAAQVLLFAPAAAIAEAEAYLGRGAQHVVSTGLEPLVLQDAILRLLRARPRLAMRVLARLSVRIGEGSSQFLCQTRDLSRTGMLAITDSVYPLGTPARFVLNLPDSPDGIHGEGEVVRHAVRAVDQVDGLGLRFLSFKGDGERRLVEFLARHGA